MDSLGATQCRRTFCGHVHIPALFHIGSSGRVGAFTPVSGVERDMLTYMRLPYARKPRRAKSALRDCRLSWLRASSAGTNLVR
jgi:hypothetical protein